jgi:2-dehydro-3-deoxyphosphogluconate aldolase/(4S)-4-hydroxy-2-oxoglutarate aldolase
MMNSGIGKNGHLAISTNSLPRAVSYLRRKGARFMKETYETDGRTIKSIYLRDEIGGFAVKLINKR